MRLLPLPGVFQPISDSRMLADCMRREEIGADTKVLDLCTGSGFLAILAAAHGAGDVTAIDVSLRSSLSVRLNAVLNGVRIRVLRGDLFAPVDGERFDLIVSNPPYVPSAAPSLPRRGPSRAWDAGPRGRIFIDRICAAAAEHLRPGGVLLLVHNAICGERQTLDLLARHGLQSGVASRHVGPLGPRLRARADWLRREGLLQPGAEDEVLVIRAQRPSLDPVAQEPMAAAGTGA